MRERVPFVRPGRPPPQIGGRTPDPDALADVPRLLAYQQLAGNAAVRDLLAGATVQRHVVAEAEAMIADVTPVNTPQGSALRIHGDRGQTDVTQLPGQDPPKEIADAYQTSTMADVHAALGAQVDLTNDLLAMPGVRRAFPRGTFDLTRMADRLKVWKAVFLAPPSGADGLSAVMAMIGRFLKAYTVHTEYNMPAVH